MKKTILNLAFILACFKINAQSSQNQSSNNLIKPADLNKNGQLELLEAQYFFDTYRNNSSKDLINDVVEDVESIVIDLISFIEGIDCSDIKRSNASKRFIEIYYRNKFLIF